jgi:serine/threonine protein kinase
MPLDQAIAIARQIAETLAAAHAVSMIHRALEPAGILLAGDRVKLLEFEIGKLAQARPTPSPRYMAPEQCASSLNAERSSDVYALGCILFEMVCGRPPFEGEPAELVELQQLAAPPLASSLCPALPAQLDVVIGAMLAKQPASRPTMADVVQQLAAVRAALPSTSTPEPAVPPPPTIPAPIEPAAPTDTHVLHQQLQTELDRYSEAKQWKQAIQVIEQFIALESDAMRKGAYYYAAAIIARDELQDLDAAIEYCNTALDCYFMRPETVSESMLPVAMQPFRAIERILTRQGDWKVLERSYRKMIVRVRPNHHKLQATLFDTLGDIYRSRLEHDSSAVQAYEMAQQLDPENATRTDGTDRAAILAELRERIG